MRPFAGYNVSRGPRREMPRWTGVWHNVLPYFYISGIRFRAGSVGVISNDSIKLMRLYTCLFTSGHNEVTTMRESSSAIGPEENVRVRSGQPGGSLQLCPRVKYEPDEGRGLPYFIDFFFQSTIKIY